MVRQGIGRILEFFFLVDGRSGVDDVDLIWDRHD